MFGCCLIFLMAHLPILRTGIIRDQADLSLIDGRKASLALVKSDLKRKKPAPPPFPCFLILCSPAFLLFQPKSLKPLVRMMAKQFKGSDCRV